MSNGYAESTNIRKEEPDMYKVIRNGGLGERASPIYYREVIAHFYIHPSG